MANELSSAVAKREPSGLMAVAAIADRCARLKTVSRDAFGWSIVVIAVTPTALATAEKATPTVIPMSFTANR
jgi:hypothetical protein